MKKQSDLKLVRIPRKPAEELVKYIQAHRESTAITEINMGRFIGQAITEKMQREPVRQ